LEGDAASGPADVHSSARTKLWPMWKLVL